MMNYRMIIIAILFFRICSLSNTGVAQHREGGYEIDGQIKDIGRTIEFLLIRNDGQRADTVNSTKSDDGKFHFTGKVALNAEFYFLKIVGVEPYARIFLDNNKIKLTGSFQKWPDVRVSGSLSHDDYLRIKAEMDVPKGKVTHLDSLIKVAAREKDTVSVSKLQRDKAIAKKHYLDVWKQIIDRNPDSYWTPSLITRLNILNYQEKRKAYEKLTDRVMKSTYGVELARVIDLQLLTNMVAVGNMLPSLISKDLSGNEVSINDLVTKNKLTLIDFWASWCVPCKEELPYLKKVYNDFKDKGFNIISISVDNSKDAWVNAIRKDAMPWMHISELKGRDEMAHKVFKLNGIPAAVLVDDSGKILALDLPGSSVISVVHSLRQDSLYAKVADILR